VRTAKIKFFFRGGSECEKCDCPGTFGRGETQPEKNVFLTEGVS
jgi:hypothetical protein